MQGTNNNSKGQRPVPADPVKELMQTALGNLFELQSANTAKNAEVAALKDEVHRLTLKSNLYARNLKLT